MLSERSEIHANALRMINNLETMMPLDRNARENARGDLAARGWARKRSFALAAPQAVAARPEMSSQTLETIESAPGNGAPPGASARPRLAAHRLEPRRTDFGA